MNRLICTMTAALALYTAGAECAVPCKPKAEQKDSPTLHCVATAHLDTQWRWTIQETITSHILSTLTVNFDRFEESPDYKFSFEGAFRYMLMKEYYPSLFERMRKYVAEGRWHVAGSSVDSGDVNVPSPESLIRHFLYGNGYFRREFGKTSCDILLPDCFGFGYVLPTVAAHCGIKGFSSQKLTWGGAIPIPFEIGRWQGVDGSTILAALNPGAYVSKIEKNLAGDEEELKKIEKTRKASGLEIGYKYFGVGDVGGGPNAKTVSWLQKSVDSTGPIHVIGVASDQLFRDLTTEQARKLPLYRGELLMKTHGTGCYTSQARMKQLNRMNELLGDAAEKAAVVADWLGGATYPAGTLAEAWIRFLWHQFHDDLTGTSIEEAYVFSWNDEVLSLNQFARVLGNGVGAVARALDTRAEGQPVVVFNPLSIDREDVVRVHMPAAKGMAEEFRVIDPEGRETPVQVVSKDSDGAEIIFLARVPSLGFSVYDVRRAEKASVATGALKVTESSMENEVYRVAIDANGDVSSIVEKVSGRELLREPIRLELIEDYSPVWPAWEIRHEDISAAPREYVSGPAKVRVVEQGPVRVTLEIVREKAGSTFRQEISLAAGRAGGRIDVKNAIDWATKKTLLKAAFPLKASNPMAVYDLGIGTIERGNNTKDCYEVPAQKWADLSDKDGEFGVAILNDNKYGWDKPDTNTLRLTLLHTPGVDKRYPDQATLDLGSHTMTYSVMGHSRGWNADNRVVWEAARLNQPLLAFSSASHEGKLGKAFGHARLSTNQVAIRALKKAEESDETVVRLQELAGMDAKGVRLSFAQPIVSAREINGAEEPVGPLSVSGGALVLGLKPYQPRTVAVKLAKVSSPESAPKSQPVHISYDADVISYDEDMPNGQFGDGDYAISGDLLPRKLECDGIRFELGPMASNQKNAVTCRGQQLKIKSGGNDRLYLLAASTGKNVDTEFGIDGTSLPLTVHSYSEMLGKSGKNGDGKIVPGAVKRAPVAWVGTHRHTRDGKNDPYQFTYLFKYSLPLAKGAKTLTLPNNPEIRLMAVSLGSNPNEDTQASGEQWPQF